MAYNITLDPGHGGHDNGTSGHGYTEKELVLRMALRTRDILENDYSGANVKMTRTTDTFISLNRRAEIARNHNSSLFCSFHMNAFNGSAQGVETFSHNNSSASNNLRSTINSAIIAELNKIKSGVNNRGLENANFAVLRGTYQHMLSVLTETLFMDSSWDADIFSDNTDQFVENAAAGHAKAIADVADLSGSYKGGSGSSGGSSGGSSSSSSGSGAPTYNGQTFAQAHKDVWMQDGYEWLQEGLNEVMNAGLSVDGTFGQKSLNATRDFHDQYGLSSNGNENYGRPGPSTKEKLEELQSSGSLPSGILKRGDRGDDVRAVQEGLVAANFYPDKSASNNGIDGIYGPDTENAVERFQSVYLSNEVDGIYGPNTKEALLEVT